MNHKIICFGETLWDMLPDGAMPGGAPMNVAVHLTYNGYSPTIISRIGNDILGKALLSVLKEKGISTSYIQTDDAHTTGIVNAHTSNKNEISYDIVGPVAWDFITYDNGLARVVRESDLFIYGSLASRNQTSCETLVQYLHLAKKKVFDVNLRPPHYTPRGIQQFMAHASIIKMNHHELTEIMSWFGNASEEKESMAYIKSRFNLEMLIVTRGENGAAVITDAGYFEHPGFQVEVEDTIGSGDAFLASLLSQLLQHTSIQKALEFACATGACVASRRGPLPQFSVAEIENFIQKQSLFPIPHFNPKVNEYENNANLS